MSKDIPIAQLKKDTRVKDLVSSLERLLARAMAEDLVPWWEIEEVERTISLFKDTKEHV